MCRALAGRPERRRRPCISRWRWRCWTPAGGCCRCVWPATLRAGPWDRFFNIVVPLSRRGFLTAITLCFAHTVGEFGVVLMVGGNIPGETRVLSIAIYDHAEALDYASAYLLSGSLLVASFLLLLGVYAVNRRYRVVHS